MRNTLKLSKKQKKGFGSVSVNALVMSEGREV